MAKNCIRYGDLNPVRKKEIGKALDPKNTSFLDSMKQSVLKLFESDALEQAGPFKGIVLRIDQPRTNPDPSSWIERAYDSVFKPILISVKVRIPELHAHIPLPGKAGNNAAAANKIIDCYPSFLAASEEVSNKPVAVGDIVLVDFGDRENLQDPVYIDHVLSSPQPGALAEIETKDSFKKDSFLQSLPPTGDAAFSLKNLRNYIPSVEFPDLELQNFRQTLGSFYEENDHVNLPAGTEEQIGTFEDAYVNGKKVGQIELTKLDRQYTGSDKDVYIAKNQEIELINMIKAAEEDGTFLLVVSGFRTYKKQKELYDGYKEQKPNYNAAAAPGYSKHQNGIAFDFNTKNHLGEEYKWMSNNAHLYGFYNEGRFFSTKEAWHWVYLGKDDPKVVREGELSYRDKIKSFK